MSEQKKTLDLSQQWKLDIATDALKEIRRHHYSFDLAYLEIAITMLKQIWYEQKGLE